MPPPPERERERHHEQSEHGAPDWRHALRRGRLVSVWFEDAAEYARFLEYVFETHAGRGLELSDEPIQTAVRVTPSLLKETRSRFPTMRPTTDEDIRRGDERVASRQALKDGALFDSDFEDRFLQFDILKNRLKRP